MTTSKSETFVLKQQATVSEAKPPALVKKDEKQQISREQLRALGGGSFVFFKPNRPYRP